MNLADLEILDYSKLKEMLVRFADSPCGVVWIEQLHPYASQAQIEGEYEVVRECLYRIERNQGFHFRGLTRSEEVLEKIRIADLVLSPPEILQVLNLIVHIHSAKRALRFQDSETPRLSALGKNLADLSDLHDLLQGKLNADGVLEDNASPALRKIRHEMIRVRHRIYQALESLMKRAESDHTIQDEVVTIRNERFVIPVRAESRKQLSGVVHGTSSSGATVFLEPLETLELNNEFARLRELEQKEIHKVLDLLTVRIRERQEEIQTGVNQLGYLDFVTAKSRFCQRFRAVIPEINQEGVLKIDNGRHPILEVTLEGSAHTVVPIDVSLDSHHRILVISGPNTGGKTVALKTVGLLTLMALSAIPVPARAANFCVVKQVFADIGDRQSISESLSTFSSHLLNIQRILKEIAPPALILLDELGTGTDPAEGSALGVAVVECLRESGVITMVTTHHNGLKMYAATTPEVSNACMEFDAKTLRPTYRLMHGIPGSSSGIEIAENLGLSPTLIAHARSLISNQERQVAQYTKQLMEEINRTSKISSSLQKERERLTLEKKNLEEEHRQARIRQAQELEDLKEKALAQFEKESQKLLSGIQDKYLAVRARRELENKSATVRQTLARTLDSSESRSVPGDSARTTTLVTDLSPQVHPGDKVRVPRYGKQGVVLATAGNAKWEVVIGNFKCVLDPSEMERVEPVGIGSPRQPVADPRIRLNLQSLELTPNEINLIGCTVDEAIERVDKFLDSAYLAALPEVRLIHGAGMGVLKRALSEWLSHHTFVSSFSQATASQGGSGVTVVTLKS
ncbi:MAG: endonuclease MutS2 [Terriglobia bacterium]